MNGSADKYAVSISVAEMRHAIIICAHKKLTYCKVEN
jgi:hypothetical protein